MIQKEIYLETSSKDWDTGGIKFANKFRQHPERQHRNVGNAAKPHDVCMIEEERSSLQKSGGSYAASLSQQQGCIHCMVESCDSCCTITSD